MPSFAYIARTREGEKVQGAVQANDRRSAVHQLERQGYVPVSVNESTKLARPPRGAKLDAASAAVKKSAAKKSAAKKAAGKTPSRRGASVRKSTGRARAAGKPGSRAGKGGLSLTLPSRRQRMNMREVLLFTREMSDLLSSGMTLGEALNTLSKRNISKSQDAIVAELRDDIVQGASLSEALSKHPDSFSSLYTSMVRAGEASGTLPEVLVRLCFHYERVQEAREKVLMALVYPSIIMLVGAGTVIFSMVFVIPRFTAIFEDLESELPASTQLLADMSEGLVNYWWIVILAGIGGYILFRRAIETDRGRHVWDGLQLRVPIIKNIICANAFAHFARTLGALLNNGVPVLNALSIVEKTVDNSIIVDEIRDARERVTDGSTISGPLSQGKVFPRLLTDMLAVGEESGNIGGALEHIANRYDRELDRTVKIFTTVLEPIMILLMAGVVGFIAVSMLSAVFGMTSGLNP